MVQHSSKPKFKTSRRHVIEAVRQFLVMLDQRLNGESQGKENDAKYFALPDGSHFDEIVALLQKRYAANPDPFDTVEDKLEEARDCLDRVTEKPARKPKPKGKA